MGIGDWIDNVGGAIENAVDEVETKAGSVIDRGAHTVADFARDHGAGGIADAIDEIGDQISNVLGGEIVEKELGQTKDKTELIHGDPSAIHDVVGKLKSMSSSIESTGDALRKIDVADWTGGAATAFHVEFDKQPKMWWTAGDAFVKAGAHLDSWYWAVETAQAKAQSAIEKWEAADKEEKSKKSAWNGLSDKEKKATPLVDTWTSMRDEARAILKGARSQRDSIAAQVVAGLQTETQDAPTEPPLSQRLSADFDDLKGVYEYGKLSFGSGLLTSFSSIVQFARSTDPLDPYNISHPAEYASSMADLGTGIVTAAADPGAVVDAMLSDARKNPFETGGAITGNIILTLATGGGGSAKVAAETVEEATNAVRLTETAANLVKDAPGAVPKGVPHVEAPALPGRGGPAVERPVEPSPGAGKPTAAQPNAVQPEASSPKPQGAGVPKPDATAPTPTGAPEGGPAAGPHPDGAAPQQPHPADSHPGTSEPGSSPAHADAPAHPDGAAAQPNPSAEPRPVEDTHEPSPAGPHADQPGQPGLAADPTGQPGLATDRTPGDGTPGPRQQPENLRTEPDSGRAHPDSDTGGSHQDKPGDAQPERPREQVQPGPRTDPDTPASPRNEPNSATPHSETPEAPHSPAADGGQPPSEHNPSHTGDPNGTQTGGHDPQPEHATPSAERQPAPGTDAQHPTLEDHAGTDQQIPDHARSGKPEDTSDLDKKTCTEDPVDIATGAFLLPETDVDLPGVLGLVLRRTHRSSYRFGRWFGPSWSATLDMRLIVDDGGATFLGEDGVVLAFPHSEVGVAVEPVAGDRGRVLTRTEAGGYRVRDLKREFDFHFAPEPGLQGIDARLGNLAISAITDRHHNRVRFHYDSDGTPTSVTHSGGYRFDVDTYLGRVTALTLVDEHADHGETHTQIRGFGYQDGNLVAVTNAVGATTRYAYDESARMLSWTDSNGNSMVNTYDEAGRVVRQRGTDGVLNCELEYLDFPDGTGHFTKITDSVGGVTTHGFDRDLRLRDVLDPAGGHTHIDYNTDRKPLKVVAPEGETTLYRYTDEGDVTQVTRPDDATVTIEYQGRNRPTAIHEPDGTMRQQEWDAAGDLVAVIDAAGARTAYAYHPNGAVASILSPTGARTIVEVDAAGLPLVVADPHGAVTRIERDAFGRPIRVLDPLGQVLCYEWTLDGKPLHRIDPDGYAESWTWDGEGNLLTHTNRAGGVTRYTYAAFDLLESVTDPDGSTTRYSWDSERRLVAVTNPLGERWTYEYDAVGRMTAETDYTGSTSRYTHDRAGRITAIAAATGITRRQRYDVLGRLTEITADSGDWIRHTYDRVGRVLTATSGTDEDPTHTLEFTYTPTGRLASQRLDDQPEMRHEHDLNSRRLRRTAPGGSVTTWNYDFVGNVRSLNADGHDISFSYDALGRATGWRLGEIGIQQSFSALGRVTAREVTAFPSSSLNLGLHSVDRPDSWIIRRDEYRYRADGYLMSHSLDRSTTAPERLDYTLDPMGRVTSVARGGRLSEAYSYDALSNILGSSSTPAAGTEATERESTNSVVGKTDSSGGERREYRNSLLVRHGRTRYHYDAAGRLIRRTVTRLSRKPAVWHYRYNAFDQLIEVKTPDGQCWRYTYDALGRRTTKQRLADDGSTSERTDYTWDGNRLIEQAVADTVNRWQYQPNSFAPITQSTDQDRIDREFYALITDLVGAPTEIVEPATGTVAATSSTDLWGRTRWAGTVATPLRFPGQIHDPETGLHYNVNRYYDPATGRYLTPDPLGLTPAPNPNTYPHNTLTWCDPLGLVPPACEYHNGELPDSGKLRDNLIAAGDHPLSPVDQAHHIVPGAIPYGDAPQARAILKEFEIGINDPANGVWLPDHARVMSPGDLRTPHHGGGVHSAANLRELTRLLRAETTREGVISVLREVADIYLSGGNLIP
ncbi:Putative deoxyribonuclease RhsC [Nocardia seriolae]|uniref:Deoxyribonuclease RhsC n=1 Tax=Nocardia seriolae TaxID=37332 RepID=A0ABC8AR49_9NOCA|nr:DUF6531 domain-containing protein [Nocardia seriolae]APA96708.1 Putative deoxyribonuclease RhsC [Nocardia seriolae]